MATTRELSDKLDWYAQNYLGEEERAVLRAAANRLRKLDEDVQSQQTSFDLRWAADRRATDRWQAAHPGNDLVWPDHADLVVWLLSQLDSVSEAAQQVLDSQVYGDGQPEPLRMYLSCTAFELRMAPKAAESYREAVRRLDVLSLALSNVKGVK